MPGLPGYAYKGYTMLKLTKDQIEFAKSMTIKQRGVLNSLFDVRLLHERERDG